MDRTEWMREMVKGEDVLDRTEWMREMVKGEDVLDRTKWMREMVKGVDVLDRTEWMREMVKGNTTLIIIRKRPWHENPLKIETRRRIKTGALAKSNPFKIPSR